MSVAEKTKTTVDSVDSLLFNLTLGQALQDEIKDSGFDKFRCIKDHGYFGWNPKMPYIPLTDIKTERDILKYLDLNKKPDKLVNVEYIRMPQYFLTLPPQEHRNSYPYGQYEFVSLYVAKHYRDVGLSDVDFAFGGSTLEMIATRNKEGDSFHAVVVPGTRVIMVVKTKNYIKNNSDVGYQFERLVTGKSMGASDDVAQVEHLHTMQICGYNVLFRAEVDAIKDGNPVEVKASNPSYWGTKVMFQMMSSGSTKLCAGHKVNRGEKVTSINMTSLFDVADTALENVSAASLQSRISNFMTAAKDKLVSGSCSKEGVVHQIKFIGSEPRFTEIQDESIISQILPPADVVKKLMQGTTVKSTVY